MKCLYLAGSLKCTPSIQLDQVTYDSTSMHPSGLGASSSRSLDPMKMICFKHGEPTSTLVMGHMVQLIQKMLVMFR